MLQGPRARKLREVVAAGTAQTPRTSGLETIARFELQHVLLASELGATLHAESLPRSPAFVRAAPGADALVLQLHGGDDYELCVTMKHEDLPAAQAALKAIGVPLTVIGTITAEPGLRLREAGAIRSIEARGYDHFQTP